MSDSAQTDGKPLALHVVRRQLKVSYPQATAVAYSNSLHRVTHYIVWSMPSISRNAVHLGIGKTSEEAWRSALVNTTRLAKKAGVQPEVQPEPELPRPR
jgi:hypothetical protein